MKLRTGVAALASVCALIVPASATAGPGGPVHLGATIANPPVTLAPGGSCREGFRVTRSGTGLRAAILGFYLSPSSAKTTGSMLLGQASLNGLRRKRSVKGVVRLRVPRTVQSGTYFLLGCVEHVRPAAGRRAASATCRAARGRVVIAAVGSIPASLPGITPHPRGVTPHRDAAHAICGTVTPDAGGTLSTTGADGTQYRLDVPAGAVLSPLAVTMTPLSSVDGLGMSGGLVGGVQMGPRRPPAARAGEADDHATSRRTDRRADRFRLPRQWRRPRPRAA